MISDKRKTNMAKMFDQMLAHIKPLRAKYPQLKFALGNCVPTVQEEYLRNHIPADIFDSLGNEAGAFMHPPETQPPDQLANNSSLWMQRQILDFYGYKDKFVSQCHEICYPSTNPGNLDPITQADYFVRHALHSLAWGVPVFRPGILMDVGTFYRFSHWGSAGFCHVQPEMNLKPSFVEFANMTLVLDGAKLCAPFPPQAKACMPKSSARPTTVPRSFPSGRCAGREP